MYIGTLILSLANCKMLCSIVSSKIIVNYSINEFRSENGCLFAVPDALRNIRNNIVFSYTSSA
jgi:hypothetical protein